MVEGRKVVKTETLKENGRTLRTEAGIRLSSQTCVLRTVGDQNARMEGMGGWGLPLNRGWG